jgi:hypothetical protein
MMYLDDTLTTEELADTRTEERATRRLVSPMAGQSANYYGIPFKAYATPNTLLAGDVIAMYAGNDEPSHAATVEDIIWSPANPHGYTLVTTEGRFDVPRDARLWVAAWAPLPR